MNDADGSGTGIDGQRHDDDAPASVPPGGDRASVPPGDEAPPPHRRDRWMVRAGLAVAAGLGTGLVIAVLAGVAGASGQAGAVLMLLALSLGTAVGALIALVSAVVEEFRGGDVGWRRPTLGTVLFVAAAMTMAMTVAAAG